MKQNSKTPKLLFPSPFVDARSGLSLVSSKAKAKAKAKANPIKLHASNVA
jgi:hypothetical protein